MSWVEVAAEQKGKERRQFSVLIPTQNDCYYYSDVERVSTVLVAEHWRTHVKTKGGISTLLAIRKTNEVQ